MSFDEWLQRTSKSSEDESRRWHLLGREIQGVVSWNINDTCNYRCSYCTQRDMIDRSGFLQDERFDFVLKQFEKLPGAWEIKLSGGEPFRQPRLEEIAARLVQQGHCISVQTNFAASRERIESFLQATRGSLHLFSASLHLEYATAEDFLERYLWVKPFESLGLRFHVTSVGVPARLQELSDVIAPIFRRAGIVFKIQPEKINGYVRDYTEHERKILLELGGHNLTGKIVNNFQGKRCFAGAKYLVIKSSGEAYRCYPASRIGGEYASCGSLERGLELQDEAKLCPYTYCNCTVPIQRGMIEGTVPQMVYPIELS